uniref:NADH-ubiquinone oxidoreductase chain 1 n=1 Tax=Xibalbanus tulumensis TaxID=1519145 RepID=Q6SKY0_XIBTU|nr:NADH dehydrogenase subunit 1 [Xibalbanus tulumensis]AAS00893.1 NADH dehydrogenase subunit 1 [Xibalbanus tulumensis]
MIPFLLYIVLIIFVLVGVAFFTLLERSVLGYVHIRYGPCSVGYLGFLQPFSDAISLFSKEYCFPSSSVYLLYYICPVFMIFLSLIVWILFPFMEVLLGMSFGLLFFVCCVGAGVYAVMVSGWCSGSKYSLLGGLRSVAQTISYEVSLAMIMMCFVLMVGSYDLGVFRLLQEGVWFVFLLSPLAFIWFASVLAELNRTPFDLAEGESELVSGFNVEYGGGGFALIFMAEYSSILFMSVLMNVIFLGGVVYFSLVVVMSFLIIWVRGTMPRMRYDFLMMLTWSGFLPISLCYITFLCGFVLLF